MVPRVGTLADFCLHTRGIKMFERFVLFDGRFSNRLFPIKYFDPITGFHPIPGKSRVEIGEYRSPGH